ncbi:MAG: hypothetical protein ACHQUC_03810 [Chlamydiales bacterium]
MWTPPSSPLGQLCTSSFSALYSDTWDQTPDSPSLQDDGSPSSSPRVTLQLPERVTEEVDHPPHDGDFSSNSGSSSLGLPNSSSPNVTTSSSLPRRVRVIRPSLKINKQLLGLGCTPNRGRSKALDGNLLTRFDAIACMLREELPPVKPAWVASADWKSLCEAKRNHTLVKFERYKQNEESKKIFSFTFSTSNLYDAVILSYIIYGDTCRHHTNWSGRSRWWTDRQGKENPYIQISNTLRDQKTKINRTIILPARLHKNREIRHLAATEQNAYLLTRMSTFFQVLVNKYGRVYLTARRSGKSARYLIPPSMLPFEEIAKAAEEACFGVRRVRP